ncbi:MAG TPA: peptide-methionine (S)-S-oxide reductase [Flavobacteriaceae bacterium]|nr:MAG: Peptide methionine sulfoxide reductase MsrA 1 [Flavobacteriaceae bacterium]HAH33832.1 peptide-methionine (S)-S-oxide reductase [Flavobacteriaceae bacterium]|tara:strand:+ start:4490 stop:5173 length:684 start_codon:yes stop_codon:yes gene_type:complete
MKRNLLFFITAILMISQASCQSKDNTTNQQRALKTQQTITPTQVAPIDGLDRAYFASGCFWCVEAVYESLKGVKESVSGYSGGHTQNPTYASSNTGRTGHAEAVEISYNAQEIQFSDLVDVYFGSQNIGQVNGQGPDRGSQYRSIIFYQNQIQKNIIDAKIKELEQTLGKGYVAAEVLPFEKFWEGESYHQNYERLNPSNPYIQNVSIPRLRKFQKKFPDLLKTKGY